MANAADTNMVTLYSCMTMSMFASYGGQHRPLLNDSSMHVLHASSTASVPSQNEQHTGAAGAHVSSPCDAAKSKLPPLLLLLLLMSTSSPASASATALLSSVVAVVLMMQRQGHTMSRVERSAELPQDDTTKMLDPHLSSESVHPHPNPSLSLPSRLCRPPLSACVGCGGMLLVSPIVASIVL